MKTSDQGLWNQLAESAIGRLAGALLRAVTAARSESVAARWVGDGLAAWQRLAASARWQLIGITLMSAVVTHVGLMLFRGPAGWMWLVIPGTVAGFAVVLLALSVSARTELSE